MAKLINKDFKRDWEQMSLDNKKHMIKMIALLACLTLIPVIGIAVSAATGAIWTNEP